MCRGAGEGSWSVHDPHHGPWDLVDEVNVDLGRGVNERHDRRANRGSEYSLSLCTRTSEDKLVSMAKHCAMKGVGGCVGRD